MSTYDGTKRATCSMVTMPWFLHDRVQADPHHRRL